MNKFKKLYIYTAFALFLLQQTSLLAQDNQQLDYIVLYSADTLYGNVKYIDEEGVHQKFYKKIRLTTIDGKRKKYKRKDVSAFRMDNVNYKSFWLNQSSQKITLVNPKYNIDNKDGQQHFLRIVSQGKLSHYELEWFEQGNATLWSMALLKKKEDPFFIRADQGLLGLKKKVLLNYFFNCPKLKEGINLKQLNNVWQVVNFYNSDCIH